MTTSLDTTTDLKSALRVANDTLDAIRLLWQTMRSNLKPGSASIGEKGEELVLQLDNLLAGTLQVAQGATDSWDVKGYNNCLTQGASAIRQLLESGPASGGQQSFNHEHCIQIADELERQVEINNKAFANGNRLSRTLRVVPTPPPAHLVDASTVVSKVKFLRLAEHAKAQDADISRLRAEVNELRFYNPEEAAVWVWQGDGDDHLETLGCPVLIQPRTLLTLINSQRDETADGGVAIRGLLLKDRVGRKPITDRFYLAECGKCGWLGSSAELRVHSSPQDDGDAACPGCGNFECDEVDTVRALELIQALVHGPNPASEGAA